MSKKKKIGEEFGQEFGFDAPAGKKSRKTEDMVMSESVSGVSRSGRVRKKSAKLMEMEDPLEMESDVDGKTKLKKQHKHLGEEHQGDLDINRKVAPIKINRLHGGSSSGTKQVSDVGQGMQAGSQVDQSGFLSTSPPIKDAENKPSKKSIKSTTKSFIPSSKMLSPLKVSVGDQEEAGLRLKLILSPKDKPSAGIGGEMDGFSHMESMPIMKMEPTKKKSKAKKKPKDESSLSTLNLLAAGGLVEEKPKPKKKSKKSAKTEMSFMKHMSATAFPQDDSLDLDIRSHELIDHSADLVIAERVPKASPSKKKKSSSKKSGSSGDSKAKIKLEPLESDFCTDGLSDLDLGSQAIVCSSSLPQRGSLYMAEKKKKVKKKKEKQGASVKNKRKGRPMTAYMLWCREHRSNIVTENPEMDFAAISRRLGEMWQALTENDKLGWRRRAKKIAAKGISTLINTGKAGQEQSRSKLLHKPQSVDGELSSQSRDFYKVVGTAPIDVAAHLKLLGESLSIIGQRLTEHEGQIAVSGSLSVLLDSTLCALGPLLCLTAEVPELNGCEKDMLGSVLDNIAYIMPGL